jgi:hypothetical protein
VLLGDSGHQGNISEGILHKVYNASNAEASLCWPDGFSRKNTDRSNCLRSHLRHYVFLVASEER